MTEITVRELGPADWETYRAVRLAALREDPEAFASTLAEEQSFPEQDWRDRMSRSVRILAEREGTPVGVASLGESANGGPSTAQIFGLWVAPDVRREGVAEELVRACAASAVRSGQTQLAYWVGTDNVRGVAFASGFGFRPGDARRKMRDSEDSEEEEILMVFPLANNRGEPTINRGF